MLFLSRIAPLSHSSMSYIIKAAICTHPSVSCFESHFGNRRQIVTTGKDTHLTEKRWRKLGKIPFIHISGKLAGDELFGCTVGCHFEQDLSVNE